MMLCKYGLPGTLLCLLIIIYATEGKTDEHKMVKFDKRKPLPTSLKDDVTLVTAYIDIGKFQKGEEHSIYYEPHIYRRWMGSFRYISNPVVAYFEDKKDIERFRAIRSNFPAERTEVIQFSRRDTWAFSLRERIEKIYAQPSYPVHHPNTVNANYSCIMHAKYELLTYAINSNPFKTKYFAWTDIGYFRDLLHDQHQNVTHLGLPPKFNTSTIAVNEVFKRQKDAPPSTVFYKNIVWLGGGFFLGAGDVMLKWAEQYKKAVLTFLDQMLMNTDQQILHAWFNMGKNEVPVTIYQANDRFNPWFHLGYICRDKLG